MAHLGRAGTFWAVAGATFTAVNCGTAAARGKVCYHSLSLYQHQTLNTSYS
jgi:hypothetical protein